MLWWNFILNYIIKTLFIPQYLLTILANLHFPAYGILLGNLKQTKERMYKQKGNRYNSPVTNQLVIRGEGFEDMVKC